MDCWDNAVAENFFHTLKVELVHRHKFRTREEAKRKIFEYVEAYYNRKRAHSTLGYLSPLEYEKRAILKETVTQWADRNRQFIALEIMSNVARFLKVELMSTRENTMWWFGLEELEENYQLLRRSLESRKPG